MHIGHKGTLLLKLLRARLIHCVSFSFFMVVLEKLWILMNLRKQCRRSAHIALCGMKTDVTLDCQSTQGP